MTSFDANGLTALLGALVAIPERLAALEREATTLRCAVEAIRLALPPQFSTPAEAAERMGVSLPTMRRWIRAGSVPTSRVGRTVRVDLARLGSANDLDVAKLARKAMGGVRP